MAKRDARSDRLKCSECGAEVVLWADAANDPPKKCFRCKGALKGNALQEAEEPTESPQQEPDEAG